MTGGAGDAIHTDYVFRLVRVKVNLYVLHVRLSRLSRKVLLRPVFSVRLDTR